FMNAMQYRPINSTGRINMQLLDCFIFVIAAFKPSAKKSKNGLRYKVYLGPLPLASGVGDVAFLPDSTWDCRLLSTRWTFLPPTIRPAVERIVKAVEMKGIFWGFPVSAVFTT